jgi:hypothetical protein
MGLRRGAGPKIACSHREAESSITLHCTAVSAAIRMLDIVMQTCTHHVEHSTQIFSQVFSDGITGNINGKYP